MSPLRNDYREHWQTAKYGLITSWRNRAIPPVAPTLRITAKMSAYQYNGQHRHWNPHTYNFDLSYNHYDWRYCIIVNGMTVLYRQNYCSWTSACASLERAMEKARKAFHT